MDAPNWRGAALRWLPLCGVAAPPLEMAVNVAVGAAQPDYNFLEHYISDLTLRGRPHGDALALLWAAFPLLFGPFALAVYAGLRGRRLAPIPPILLGAFALFIGLCGFFRYDPFNPYDFLSRGHLIVSALANSAVFPVPFFFWLATRRDVSWRRLGRFSLVIQAAGAVAMLLLAFAFFRAIPWGGPCEWLVYGVYYVWVVVLAARLRAMGRAVSSR